MRTHREKNGLHAFTVRSMRRGYGGGQASIRVVRISSREKGGGDTHTMPAKLHSVGNENMTRRCDSSQPTPTPLPCEATKPHGMCYSKKPQTKNGRRKKGYRTLQRMAGSTGARAITSANCRGKRGQRKGKTGTMQKKRNNNKRRKRWGRRRKSHKPREQNSKRPQKRTRTRLRTKPNS